MSIPDEERLRGDVGRTYGFGVTVWAAERISLTLAEVIEGRPMSARYRCYIACFVLPQGLALPQLSGELSAGDEVWPDLLLTPTLPDAQGRARMQAVFHCLIPQTEARTETSV